MSTILDKLKAKHTDDVFVAECKNGPTHTASHRRLDAWVMKKSWSPITMLGYEIKQSRSDFLQDNKWQAYLPCCHQLYFVCPKGYWDMPGMVFEKSLWLLCSITLGIMVFLVSSFLLRSSELFSLIDFMKSKRR